MGNKSPKKTPLSDQNLPNQPLKKEEIKFFLESPTKSPFKNEKYSVEIGDGFQLDLIKSDQTSIEENKTKEIALNFKKPNDPKLKINHSQTIEQKIEEKQPVISPPKRSKKKALTVGCLWRDIRKEYKFREVLSTGHFGTVRMAFKREDNNKNVAIKSISKKNLTIEDLQDLMKEVEILASLDHPNIVKFYEAYQDQFFVHIVMELCTGKEVFEKMIEEKSITEIKICKIIYKLLSAICYCHSVGVTHRDIKPENILFENNENDSEIKLIDFGLSRQYDKNEKLYTILGTPYYVAPEILKGEYDQKCDIWSIGALTYLMLSGNPPFTGKNNNLIFEKILNQEVDYEPLKNKNITPDAISFIKSCLVKESDKRLVAAKAIEHIWFKSISNEFNSKLLPKEIIHNMKNYSAPRKFKKLVMKFLLNYLESSELKQLRECFLSLDLNKEGKISIHDFKNVIEKSSVTLTENEIKRIFNNTSGKINYSDFLIACMNEKKMINKERVLMAFKYFDLDENGVIDSEDLKNTLIRSGKEVLNNQEVEEMIYEISKNRGSINEKNFLMMFNFTK